MIRYRTESFSGEGFRDAAAVMAFETKELGNTDILEYLRGHVLEDGPLVHKMDGFIREMDDNGFIDDMSDDDMESFFKEVLDEIGRLHGVNIRYALWLADTDVIFSADCGYGRDLTDDYPIDAYETGPVILSDLGYDGTLYGYETYPEPVYSIECAELRRQVEASSLDKKISVAANQVKAEQVINQNKDYVR